MRMIVMAVGLLILAAASVEGESARSDARAPGTAITNPITDLVLIYDGSPRRGVWSPERFKPYVLREKEGEVEWLFDGFLFIEFLAKSGARLCPITNRKDADKRDWQDLIDHYFQAGQSIPALEQLMASLAAKGNQPARKRKVVITLPTPITGSSPDRIDISSDWGELGGRKLDFHNQADRFSAATWYIDEVLKRWEESKFKHLELAGFYWVFERAWKVHHTAELGRYLRAKGSRLYWIPSWPQGRKNWSQYGFDFVYQQPNYFFHRQPTEADRLDTACKFAADGGTSMEMEFNQDLLTKPAFQKYFDEYLEAFSKYGVWEKQPVAYYEGGGTWSEMSKSADPDVKRRFEALAALIVERQKKADQGFVFRQGAE